MRFPSFFGKKAQNRVCNTSTDYVADIIPEHLLSNARVLPTRNHLFPLLPKKINFCEVGVALGDYSAEVFKRCDVEKFVAIDTFDLHNQPEYWGGRVGTMLGQNTHRAFYEAKFKSQLERGLLEIVQATSVEGISGLSDDSIDVSYIDALHDYEGVSKDLSLIRPKMKKGGIIIANDYVMYDYHSQKPFGVIQAVNDFMIQYNWEMIYFVLYANMYCDVALREFVDQ